MWSPTLWQHGAGPDPDNDTRSYVPAATQMWDRSRADAQRLVTVDELKHIPARQSESDGREATAVAPERAAAVLSGTH